MVQESIDANGFDYDLLFKVICEFEDQIQTNHAISPAYLEQF